MGHGRFEPPFSTHASYPTRTLELLLVVCMLAGTACGSQDPAEGDGDGPGTAVDSRSWSVGSPDESSDEASHDAGYASDASSTDATHRDDARSSDTTELDPPPIRCQDGQAPEAAFEGSANDPAVRVTIYVRDDCGVVGSVATSTHQGNYNLTVRGRLDTAGAVSMTGRTTANHAELTGELGAEAAAVDLDANFDGVSVNRAISLLRID